MMFFLHFLCNIFIVLKIFTIFAYRFSKIWTDLLTKTRFYLTISPEAHAEQTVVGYNDQSISGKGGMRIKFY